MRNLYRFQQRVLDTLMSGKNVILQAPTGGGKTLAALYPFLHNLDRYGLDELESVSAQAPLPLTCRYAVPMRVLASQFEREYQEYITNLDAKRGTRLRERYTEGLGVSVPAIQTGETPNDPRFESPLTFCTIDQLLASFIGSPYSLGGRQANLNVGAVAGSYLVLDEFHLYPLEGGKGAWNTTLAMLRLLNGLCRFVLMTATFSTTLLDELGALLDAEVIRVTDEDELAQIMGDRSRTLRVSVHALNAEGILTAHTAACERGAGASLIVCNTVAQAQNIYTQLRDVLAERDATDRTQLQLLHSRFTPADRQTKRELLEKWLGKDAWSGGRYLASTIVVATQVVEVGLNISVGVLHSELAPANSLIQRAGRCARFAGQQGEVVIYHPLAPQDGLRDDDQSLLEFGALDDDSPMGQRKAKSVYLPYDRTSCEATWRALVRRTGAPGDSAGLAPAPFAFADEQSLIDAVHTDADRAMIEQFHRTIGQTNDLIKESLRTHEAGAGAELIRDVADVSVIIHDNPASIDIRPFDWDAFSLRPSTLLKHWESLCNRKEALDLGWVMMTMEPESGERGSNQDESDNSREPRYIWKSVIQETYKTQITSALRLALPSALATYDSELGFQLLLDDATPSTSWVSQPSANTRTRGRTFGGKQASYVEHITGLMRAYNYSVRRELLWIAQQLETRLRLSPGSIDEAVRLAIACHDIGKLSCDWQTWAHAWQAKLVATYGAGYAVQSGRAFLAKTDRPQEWRDERALQSALKERRPNHSCVGVIAAGQLIAQRLLERAEDSERVGPLALATYSAIARHHAPMATAYDAATWDTEAREVIEQALKTCGISPTPAQMAFLTLGVTDKCALPDDYLVVPNFDRVNSAIGDTPTLATWLGFVLVRALRLCDQRAERDLA